MTYRNPSLLAAEAITVDHISAGRLDIAVGAAWFEGEHRAFGWRFPGVRGRAGRLEEGIQVLRALMTEDDVTFDGRYYHLEHATYRPRPVQQPHPPIWVGAAGERLTLPIVARQADVWHASAPVDEMLRKSALIDRYAREAGRDPANVARAGSVRPAENWDAIRRDAHTFRQGGFSHLVCVWPPAGLARLDAFARTLLPELQSL